MKQGIILTSVFIALFIFPLISADVIIQQVDKASGVILNDTIDVELRNATVEINAGGRDAYLTARFEVYSNENEVQRTVVYLKAKGEECYNSCHDVEVAEYSTSFNVNNDVEVGTIVGENSEGVSKTAETYETSDGKFAGVEFDLLPNQINTIEVYQDITLPFEYYLDSLSTFSKADHEKITINGSDLNVQFNEKYPVKKVSENEWVWEYSNINTSDEDLKDALTISRVNSSEPPPRPTPGPRPIPEPKKSFLQKIIDWFRNLF